MPDAEIWESVGVPKVYSGVKVRALSRTLPHKLLQTVSSLQRGIVMLQHVSSTLLVPGKENGDATVYIYFFMVICV